MISELKPCPFCGSSAKLEVTICDSVVRCTICSCRVLLKNPRIGNCRDTVVLAWNTRAPDPEAIEAAFRMGLEVAMKNVSKIFSQRGIMGKYWSLLTNRAIRAIDPAQHLGRE